MSWEDWEAAANAIEAEVITSLRALLKGAEEDLQELGRTIAAEMLVAIQAGNVAKRAELLQQLEGIVELHRLKAVNVQFDVIQRVTGAIFGMAFRLLGVPPPPAEGGST